MKCTITTALVMGAAALANAQVSFVNGTFKCAIANGTYCAGDSLTSNIIIRCASGVGQPGNCNDNLAGEPPVGVNPALCYQTSDVAGDAACSKNGTVYPDSGASFPVPSNGTSTNSTSTSTRTILSSGTSVVSVSSGPATSSPVSYKSTVVVTYTMSTRTHTDTENCPPSGSAAPPPPASPPAETSSASKVPSGSAGVSSAPPSSPSASIPSPTTTTFATPTPTSTPAVNGGSSHKDLQALSAFAGFGVLVIAAALF